MQNFDINHAYTQKISCAEFTNAPAINQEYTVSTTDIKTHGKNKIPHVKFLSLCMQNITWKIGRMPMLQFMNFIVVN